MPQPGRTRTVACPNCGGSVKIRANGLSISAACASCGAILDVTNADIRMIGEAQARTRHPLIELGTRAHLVGSLWEVVGFQTRSDVVEGWSWDEYLLFSPYEGFRFLVQDEENWTLYALLPQDVPNPLYGAGDRQQYRPVSTSRARTDYVMGEFYWRVRVGDEVDIQEFEASSYLLSREQAATEVTWSRGVRLTAADITTAFKLPSQAVPPTAFERGVDHRSDSKAVWLITLAALLGLMVLAAAPFGLSRNALLLSQQFTTTVADRSRPVATPDFTVPDSGGNLQIAVGSAVVNSWVELGLALVDTADARTFNADVTVEEYEGVDEDGSWSEGSQASGAVFARVPGGTYRLLIDTDALAYTQHGRQLPQPVSFVVEVRRHVPSLDIFLVAALLLVIFPIGRWLRDRIAS